MALTFNGNVANYVEKAITFSASKGTLMAWVKLTSDPNTYQCIFETNAVDNNQAGLYTQADGTTISTYLGASNTTATGSSLSVGTWYHLAITWDGTSFRTYVDATLNITHTNTGSTWNRVQLGFGEPYWGDSFVGAIAHVKAWDATLSQSEIASEKDSIPAVRTSNLKGEWKTTEDSNRLNDTSGNGNHFTGHGTLTDTTNPLTESSGIDGTLSKTLDGASATATGVVTSTVPSFVAVQSSTSGSGVTSRTVTVPSHTDDTDVLLAVCLVELANATVTADSAWGSPIIAVTPGTRTLSLVVFAKIAHNEPSDYTFSWTSAECAAAIICYHDVSLPATYNAQGNNSTTSSVTAPSLTPTVSPAMSVWCGAILYGTTFTPPTNYVERLDVRTSTGSTNMALSIAERLISGTSATGTIVGTSANADYNAGAHILLYPQVYAAASPTLSGSTVSATGTIGSASIDGTLSVTLTTTLAATGTVATAGATGATLDNTTLSAPGTVAIAGTGTGSSSSTLASTGTGAVAASTAVTLAATSVASTAAAAIAATFAATVVSYAVASTGTVNLSGSSAPTLVGSSVAATGTVALAASLAKSLSDTTLASSATVPVTGQATANIASTVVAPAAVAVAALLDFSLAAVAVTATGRLPVSGTAGSSTDVVLSAAGTVEFSGNLGTADLLLAAVQSASSGQVAIAATLAKTVGATLAATATVATTGSCAGTVSVSVTTVGQVAISGETDFAAKIVALSAIGSLPIAATCVVATGISLAANGTIAVTGVSAVTTSTGLLAEIVLGEVPLYGNATAEVSVTLAAFATLPVTGNFAVNLISAFSATAAADVTAIAEAALSLATQLQATVEIAGEMYFALPDVIATGLSEYSPIAGSASVVLANVTVLAQGYSIAQLIVVLGSVQGPGRNSSVAGPGGVGSASGPGQFGSIIGEV